jgi:hypothetical protein
MKALADLISYHLTTDGKGITLKGYYSEDGKDYELYVSLPLSLREASKLS